MTSLTNIHQKQNKDDKLFALSGLFTNSKSSKKKNRHYYSYLLYNHILETFFPLNFTKWKFIHNKLCMKVIASFKMLAYMLLLQKNTFNFSLVYDKLCFSTYIFLFIKLQINYYTHIKPYRILNTNFIHGATSTQMWT